VLNQHPARQQRFLPRPLKCRHYADFASQTGNARRVAEALRDDLLAAQLNVKLVNAGDYKFKQIAPKLLLVS
jgi:sulfite reductase alpha subunit-like flavoprotein